MSTDKQQCSHATGHSLCTGSHTCDCTGIHHNRSEPGQHSPVVPASSCRPHFPMQEHPSPYKGRLVVATAGVNAPLARTAWKTLPRSLLSLKRHCMVSNRQHVSGTKCWSRCCMTLISYGVALTLLCSFANAAGASSSSGLMTCLSTIADVMETLCEQILSRFKSRSEGQIGHFLGMEILRDRKPRTMTITHRKMIKHLLSANSMQGYRTSPTPLVPKETLKSMKKDPSQEPAAAIATATFSEHQRYMKVVGGIQYIAVVTRPDTAFAAHSMAASAQLPWLAALHVLRYLQKTVNLGLFWGSMGYTVIEAYADADFANALSLKSVSGNMLMMYGSCVFWRSKRQDMTARNTADPELIGMSAAANEQMWLKKLCIDFAITAKKPTLWGDNKSSNVTSILWIGCRLLIHMMRIGCLLCIHMVGGCRLPNTGETGCIF